MFSLDNDIVCGLEQVTAALTIPFEMLQIAVEELSRRPCCPGELLQTHAAKVFAIDVELLERDATGIQLIGVQKVLEPLPHLVLGPILRMDLMPLASKKPAGNAARGIAVRPGGLLVVEIVAGVQIHYTTSFQNHDL